MFTLSTRDALATLCDPLRCCICAHSPIRLTFLLSRSPVYSWTRTSSPFADSFATCLIKTFRSTFYARVSILAKIFDTLSILHATWTFLYGMHRRNTRHGMQIFSTFTSKFVTEFRLLACGRRSYFHGSTSIAISAVKCAKTIPVIPMLRSEVYCRRKFALEASRNERGVSRLVSPFSSRPL